jgi:hypothetical protein
MASRTLNPDSEIYSTVGNEANEEQSVGRFLLLELFRTSSPARTR